MTGKFVKVCLTRKELEIHRWIICTMATDGLVLKHQAISTHSAE